MLRILTGLFVCCLCAHAALVYATRHAGYQRRPVDLQSATLLNYRLSTAGEGPDGDAARPLVVFLGDSLVYGGKLVERHPDDWWEHTLPAQFATASSGRFRVLNLGVNGALFGDLRCVLAAAARLRPAWVVLDVSVRPFASGFAEGGQQSARPALCDADSPVQRLRAATPLLGLRDLIHAQWLGVTPSQWVVDGIRRVTAPVDPFADGPGEDDAFDDAEDDAELADQIWRFKAAQRLNSVDVEPGHPQWAAMEGLLSDLHRLSDTRSLIFLPAMDTAMLGEQLAQARLDEMTERLVGRLGADADADPSMQLLTLQARDFAGHYDDHVHLDVAGYGRLSEVLMAAIARAEGSTGGSR